jgi:hypothetical protein
LLRNLCQAQQQQQQQQQVRGPELTFLSMQVQRKAILRSVPSNPATVNMQTSFAAYHDAML